MTYIKPPPCCTSRDLVTVTFSITKHHQKETDTGDEDFQIVAFQCLQKYNAINGF